MTPFLRSNCVRFSEVTNTNHEMRQFLKTSCIIVLIFIKYNWYEFKLIVAQKNVEGYYHCSTCSCLVG